MGQSPLRHPEEPAPVRRPGPAAGTGRVPLPTWAEPHKGKGKGHVEKAQAHVRRGRLRRSKAVEGAVHKRLATCSRLAPMKWDAQPVLSVPRLRQAMGTTAQRGAPRAAVNGGVGAPAPENPPAPLRPVPILAVALSAPASHKPVDNSQLCRAHVKKFGVY